MRNKRLAIGGIFLIAVLALAVAACGGYDDDDDSGGLPQNGEALEAPGGDDSEGAPDAFDGASGGNDYSVTSDNQGGVGAGPGNQVSAFDRKIIRDATLEVTVENVPSAVAQIENIATRAGGFISSSSMTIENPQDEDEEQRQRATISIRVPAVQYASVLSDLRGIAEEVRSESSHATEVTEEYTDLSSQLRNLEATESQYLELLTRADTIDEILTVQDRLNSVRGQIEQVQGRLNVLDDLTDLATITLDVQLPPIAIEIVKEPNEQNWAQEAWTDAWDVSQDALRIVGVVAISAAVLMLWLIIPAAVAGGALWVATRRNRSQTTTSP